MVMKSSTPLSSSSSLPMMMMLSWWCFCLPIISCLAQEDTNNNNTVTTTEEESSATTTTTNTTTDDSNGCLATDDSVTLRNTCKLYGSIFLVVFVLFCVLRRRYIKTYAIRSWAGNHQSTLAKTEYGYLEWIYRIALISDDDLLKECGMDGLCLIRINYFGLKLCAFAILNAIWLMPVWATSKESPETACITDSIQSLSISNVPSGSNRLICATIAAYLMFGFAMYSIVIELDWLKTYRHKFLRQPMARNYAIYLRCIPSEFLDDNKITDYFNQIFHGKDCIESNIALKIPNLQKLVSERDTTLGKLEHAINIQNSTGIVPMHSTKLCGGEKVDSIMTYSQELAQLNTNVKESLEKLELQHQHDQDQLQKGSNKTSENENNGSIKDTRKTLKEGDGAENKSFAQRHASKVTELLSGNPDGEKLTAAFVSFNSLNAANIALQVELYDQPHEMESCEAPDPDDILWNNIGKTHQSLQIGKLISLTLTVLICLFWTFVIVFASSLSSIEGLREIQWIDDALNKAPWLVPVLAQIAPFIVVAVNALLRVFLQIFSSLELPISAATLESSLFGKLSVFMIIHNFFVASIGGAASEAFTSLVEDPASIVDLLATSLPAQSTFHTQILLVNVFLSMSLELLGVSRLAVAWIRQLFGPGLTEKERSSPWMGLKPLNDPDPFIHSLYTSWNVLYFMVLFVYSTIAPITSFFMALCFMIMWICFRYLFIYIYPVVPDSGGKLYFSLLNLTLVIMVISEITVLGLLAIKLSAIGSTLMIPLLIITILFNIYVKQKHFKIAEHLPTIRGLDIEEEDQALQAKDFLLGAYTQPELKAEKESLPELLPGILSLASGSFHGGQDEEAPTATVGSKVEESAVPEHVAESDDAAGGQEASIDVVASEDIST